MSEVTTSTDSTTSGDPLPPSGIRGKVNYIQGRYLKRRRRLPDFKNFGKTVLLDRINELNNTKFTLNDLEFGTPVAQPDATYNTRVRIYAKPSTGLTQHVDVQYNRYGILNALPSRELVGFTPTSTAESTVHDHLNMINYEFGVALRPEDVYDDPVPTDGSWIRLRVKTTSYIYVADDWDSIAMSDHLSVTDLTGFTAPIISLDTIVLERDLSGFTEPVDSLASILTKVDLDGFTAQTTVEEPVSLFGMLKTDL